MSTHHDSSSRTPACLSRREMLIFGGTSLAVLASLPGLASAQVVGSRYKRQTIAKLSTLAADAPVAFDYPRKGITNVLVRLGETAGGGVGPQYDIVAFNSLCTHMGGPVGPETYQARHKTLGPCPLHLTTFDLTRHGMVVSGHATQSLPQVMLEVRGDDIVAVGMMGLVYGYAENPKA